MEPTDLTLEALKNLQTDLRGVREEIRSESRSIREELHTEIRGVRDEVRETNVRVDRLERRQIESDMRLATEIVAVAGAVRELRDLFKDDLAVRHEVRDLQHRVGALETHEQ